MALAVGLLISCVCNSITLLYPRSDWFVFYLLRRVLCILLCFIGIFVREDQQNQLGRNSVVTMQIMNGCRESNAMLYMKYDIFLSSWLDLSHSCETGLFCHYQINATRDNLINTMFLVHSLWF